MWFEEGEELRGGVWELWGGICESRLFLKKKSVEIWFEELKFDYRCICIFVVLGVFFCVV